jgi:hypothetical protein
MFIVNDLTFKERITMNMRQNSTNVHKSFFVIIRPPWRTSRALQRRARVEFVGDKMVSEQVKEEDQRRIAQAVREACVRAALEGYEQAGLSGLCDEGRWEMAIDSIRSLDVDALLHEVARESK